MTDLQLLMELLYLYDAKNWRFPDKKAPDCKKQEEQINHNIRSVI